MASLLIVDDCADNRALLRELMVSCAPSWRVAEANSLSSALEYVRTEGADVVLLDVFLGDAKGSTALPQFKALDPRLEVIVVSSSEETDDVLEALRNGALTYFTRPVHPELLRIYLNVALSQRRLKAEGERLRAQLGPQMPWGRLIGSHPLTARLRAQLQRLALVRSPILVLGETGTGKGVVAAELHRIRQASGGAKDRPFLNLSMAAMNSNLLESELFGHEKGAFTDAKTAQPGFLELADGGDLFLDEIGDASLSLQAKLLKAIQERSFYRLGGRTLVRSDFSVIAATNRDLTAESRAGTFRLDLLQRFTFTVHVPPLRSRASDIPELVDHWIEGLGGPESQILRWASLPEDLRDALMRYSYPGNVRELESLVERIVLLWRSNEPLRWASVQEHDEWPEKPSGSGSADPLSWDEFLRRPLAFSCPGEMLPLEEAQLAFERKIFEQARRLCQNQNEMAKLLQVAPSTVSIKLRRLNPR